MKEKKIDLIGQTDSDYAGDLEDRKSTSGYLFSYKGCLVSWNSSKKKLFHYLQQKQNMLAFRKQHKKLFV